MYLLKELQLVTLWSYVHFREMLTLLSSGNHLQVWEEMHLSDGTKSIRTCRSWRLTQ